ncbi:hypothetical protein HYPSUDRAFT_218052 [Hypholoma sublateritium FD-334 SS-4]|uniref:Uncharacterized protein n=1 Tax=Hypholoma sublateritium (strain FD-334 SS-4) TaxID=945553 RepID=A0A0D2M682_HYPSF|nr:hypothetical protein HYPSUDRAFT_218052 [Hypholoma sublateritium FD-334 SS-4]
MSFPTPTTTSTSSTSSVISITSAVAPSTTSSTSAISAPIETPTGNTVIIDDRSPSLVYAGSWNQGGIASEFGGTDTWTNASGSTASIDFSGTQISVWGTVAMIGVGVAPQSSYSIDDGTPVLFVGIQRSDPQYMQLFFQSDTLPFNNHTLRIETLASGGDYSLDFLSVVPLNSTGASSPSTSTSPITATAAAHSSTKNVPIGAILGGVLGGIGVIALTIIGVLFLKRKQSDESHKIDYFPVTQIARSPAVATVYPATKSDITDGHDTTASEPYFSHHRPSAPPPKYEHK